LKRRKELQSAPYFLASTEIMRVLGKEWNIMDKSDKAKYEEIS